MIKVILADDEELALDSMLYLLNQESDIEVLCTCRNGLEAFEACNQYHADVIFLDIQMPGLSGIEVAELIENQETLIVFITAFDEYAVKAFETHAIDYLLKPVNPQRLRQCLNRVKERLRERYKNNLKSSLTELKALHTGRILVKEKNNLHIIEYNDIFYFEAQDDYAAIFSKQGLFLKKETLTYLENILPKNFIRIHRSYIINMDFVERIEDAKSVVFKDGKKVPVSRTGLKKVMNK